MSTIDLHIHSIKSNDGEFTSKQLLERAHRLNMRMITISDHDGVSAIDEGLYYADKYGIKLIPGCEISARTDDGTDIHVLGLNINHRDKRFIERENKIKEICRKNSDTFMNAALNYGFKFDKEVVLNKANDGVVTEEMIGETIINDSRNDNDERLLEYRKGGSKADNPGFNFYKEFYGQGKPCYVTLPDVCLSLKETSELIHSTGGIMVLAHPAYNIKRDLSKLEQIYSYGLDGIEVYSSYHSKEDIEFYFEQTKRLDLIRTVGSDFHGKCKPAIEMGSVDCDENEIIENLRKKIKI